MGRKTRSISTTLLISFLLVVFLSLVIQAILWLTKIYSVGSIQQEQIQQQYIQTHKRIIKNEVDQIIADIDLIQTHTERRLKQQIKRRVNTAYAIAINIYNNNISKKQRCDLQRMILDAIAPLLTNDSKKFHLIGTLAGDLLLADEHFTADNTTPLTSIAAITTALDGQTEGYTSWRGQPGLPDEKYNHLIFTKQFAPLNLIIGLGFSQEDMIQETQSDVLKRINRRRYGDQGNGYLFAFQYDGLYLSHIAPKYIGQNMLELTDPNGVYMNKEIVEVCKKGGGYVGYVWDRYKSGELIDKISYVKGYDRWQWAIGTGFYLDDLQVAIDAQKNILREQLHHFLPQIIFFSILIFLFSGIIINFIVGKLHGELAAFHEFFARSATKSKKIDLKKINYTEFKQLAENANTMLSNRMATEKALTQSEKQFRHLIGDIPKLAVQGYDHDRTINFWNPASEELYGYSKQEALGQKLEELIIPVAMRQFAIDAIQNWYEKNEAIPASEMILLHKDGHDVPVFSSHVMLKSSNGEKTMFCIDLDLAELRLAQEKERKISLFYQQLFNHSTSGVAVYEAVDQGNDFILKDINKAGEEIEQQSRENLIGHKISQMFPDTKECRLLDLFREVWQTGTPVHQPISHHKDGALLGWRENRVYKLPTGEIATIYDDVTRQKKLEEEKQAVEMRLHRAQKMEAIGLMAGGVAHDLNNILTGITGYPELLLLQLPPDSDLRQSIEAIKESGERAAAVVADLLTVARGIASTRNPANLNDLIREYLDSPEWRQLHFLHQHIQCETNLAPELPNISCSAIHIEKCIMNLLTNAVEAINTSGGITLSTSKVHPDKQWATEHELHQQEYVLLSVEDTGAGIRKEDINHIFEPFYTKKMMGRSGTGLGLAVVWNTIEDHEGKILVESDASGTRFDLYLPSCGSQNIETEHNSGITKQSSRNEHILVVDDEPHLRDIAEKMLQSAGYRVDSVCSGELALEFIKKTPVDLLVIDMLMDPGMNGYHTYEQILKLYPRQKAIIASGFSESDDVQAALKLGASGFIKKPYSIAQLSQAVATGLHPPTGTDRMG